MPSSVLPILLSLAGCGLFEEAPPEPPKILLVGIDGATLDVVRPLVEAGELPHFAELMAAGTAIPLRSEEPTLSPAVWTTILTGQRRKDHGVTGMQRPDGRLFTSADRTAPALWQVLTAEEITSGWVGFWATWPAEAVDGWLVSDRFARSRETYWGGGRATRYATFPESLALELESLRVDPMTLDLAPLEADVPLTDAERAEFRAFTRPRGAHAWSVLKFAWAAQQTYQRIALHQLEEHGQPDVLGVYLVLPDPVSHTTWHHYQPSPDPKARRQADPRLGGLVPFAYRQCDAFLGELLEAVDEETAVLVVSDHGFTNARWEPRTEAARPGEVAGRWTGDVTVGQSGGHHTDGLLIAAGGPFRRGATVDAHVADVAPTLLALAGVPVADDMEGRVLEELIEPEFLEAQPVGRIPTWETRVEAGPVPEGAPGEAELLEDLRALGYVE